MVDIRGDSLELFTSQDLVFYLFSHYLKMRQIVFGIFVDHCRQPLNDLLGKNFSLPLLPWRENKVNDSSATIHAGKSRPIPTPPTDDVVDGASDDIVVTYCAVIGNDEFDGIR